MSCSRHVKYVIYATRGGSLVANKARGEAEYREIDHTPRAINHKGTPRQS